MGKSGVLQRLMQQLLTRRGPQWDGGISNSRANSSPKRRASQRLAAGAGGGGHSPPEKPGNDVRENVGDGNNDQESEEEEDDPGKAALATAGVLFDEGKLTQKVGFGSITSQ